MDLVQAFIKDQFQDDEEYYEEQKKKRSNPGREVQHLKKELEELKFYQELERTEFEDMKRKMSKLQKNKNSSGAKTSRTMTQDTGLTSADIFDSLSDDASTPDLREKLQKKDEEIAKLQKTLKTETSPKEFGKRMHKLEKSKNEEIEEIKNHYKGLMEQLAKQIQKANERHDDEVGKNAALRNTMEEMRQDMAFREQELEDKLLEMERGLKSVEIKTSNVEGAYSTTQQKLADVESQLAKAEQDLQDMEQKMRELEEDFEDERKEIFDKEEQRVKDMEDQHRAEIEERDHSIDELKIKLEETFEKLEVEERAHEDTVIQLKDTQKIVENLEESVDTLTQELDESKNEARLARISKDNEVLEVKEDRKSKIGALHEKINGLASDKIQLTNELKETLAKLKAAEKKVDLMHDNSNQKQGALRRKNSELEQLQLELRDLCDKHIKENKARDMQIVRERKKWAATQNTLTRELEDLKTSPAFLKMQNSSSANTNIENASSDELKSMVENLRAEKQSLLLQLTATKERATRDMRKLEKQLEEGKDKEADAESSMLQKFLYNKSKKIETPSTPAPKPNIYTTFKKAGNDQSLKSMSSMTEVSVGPSKVNRGSLSSTAYRRQLRQRKMGNKAAE